MANRSVETLRADFTQRVKRDLDACNGCGDCLTACPASFDEQISIDKLNNQTRAGRPVTSDVEQFAINCHQCGMCVPVCPTGVRRDWLMIAIKEGLSNPPESYQAYTQARSAQNASDFILKKAKSLVGKVTLGALSEHIDKKNFKRAKTLLYLGDAVFESPEQSTVAFELLTKNEESFEVLAGMQSTSGYPLFWQGKITEAESSMEQLRRSLVRVAPKQIIVVNGEVIPAISRAIADMESRPAVQTLTDYVSNLESLPKPTKLQLVPHDSCTIKRFSPQYKKLRALLNKMGQVVEPARSKSQAPCCRAFNFGSDPNDEQARKDRFEEVSDVGQIMVVDSFTCAQTYNTARNKFVEELSESQDYERASLAIPILDVASLVSLHTEGKLEQWYNEQIDALPKPEQPTLASEEEEDADDSSEDAEDSGESETTAPEKSATSSHNTESHKEESEDDEKKKAEEPTDEEEEEPSGDDDSATDENSSKATEPEPVDNQIVDSVTQTNVKVVGDDSVESIDNETKDDNDDNNNIDDASNSSNSEDETRIAKEGEK